MSFDFFTSKLDEMREYRSYLDYMELIGLYMKRPGAKGSFVYLNSDESGTYNDHFRASHYVCAADGASTLGLVESTFRVELPEDFLAFHRIWSEALLVLRDPYWIMPGALIVKMNQRLRGPYDPDFPCNLVRFARWADESWTNFALRRKHPGAPWTVSMIDDTDTPEDENEAGHDRFDCKVTDQSFTDWLRRMLDTDGTPWIPGNDETEEKLCKTIRVG